MSRGQVLSVVFIAGLLFALLLPAMLHRTPKNSHGQVITNTEREILDELAAIKQQLSRLEAKLGK